MKKYLLMIMIVFTVVTQAGECRLRGGFISLSALGTSMDAEITGIAKGRLGLNLNNKWAIGLTGSSFFHGPERTKLVNDGTYHLNIQYGGLFVEYNLLTHDRLATSLSFMSGMGSAFFQYDHEYRKNKVWTEEIIDQTSFGVQELALNINIRVAGPWWLGVTGSLRNTAPLELIQTSDDLIKKANAGVQITYTF